MEGRDFIEILRFIGIWSASALLWLAVTVTARAARAGSEHPVSDLRRYHWPIAAILLSAVHMAAFLIVKPQLNVIAPMWADPALAATDRLLLFGRDAPSVLSFLNTEFWARFYHRSWFPLLVIAVATVMARPPTAERRALLLTYYGTWIVGPLIHLLLPAKGPVFDPGFPAVPTTAAMAANLATHFERGDFWLGSGISAMPSLHVAMTLWFCLVARRTAAFWPSVAYAILIFLLSIALGWHYAVDGLAGAAVVGLLYGLAVFVGPTVRLRLPNPDGQLAQEDPSPSSST